VAKIETKRGRGTKRIGREMKIEKERKIEKKTPQSMTCEKCSERSSSEEYKMGEIRPKTRSGNCREVGEKSPIYKTEGDVIWTSDLTRESLTKKKGKKETQGNHPLVGKVKCILSLKNCTSEKTVSTLGGNLIGGLEITLTERK